MYCKNCGKEMNDNQAICLECGYKAGDGDKHCANCGSQLAPNAAVCLNCGVATKKMADGGNLNGKDKITIALLCFFLGGFGVHNFVMGETKRGIVRIVASLCCGLGCILALIDFIKILLDKYEYDPEKLI
ncbi:MAG: NINE protein [Clostridia bacterium]|nr:NINE protein [Clostridia bacterium]